MPTNSIACMQIFSQSLKLMGNNFTISVVDEEEAVAQTHIQTAIDEIRRIEQLFTTFKSDSQTNLINDNAGIQTVIVDKEVYDLI